MANLKLRARMRQLIDDKKQLDTWDPMGEDYHSSKNTLAINPDKNPEALVTGMYMSNDDKIGDLKICNHFSKYGSCADGQYCDRLHVNPREREKLWSIQDTFEKNKNRVVLTADYLSPIELDINPEARMLVTITNAKLPNNFYIVAPYEQMNFAVYEQEDINFYIDRVTRSSSVRTKFDKLHEQLKALFDHHYRIDNVNDEIYLNQIVACKLSDGRYHRAMVIDTPNLHIDKFDYRLLLLDIGAEVELSRELLFDIKANCLSEPPMAINCRLDIKPANGTVSWSQEALDFFVQQTKGDQYWLCQILGYISLSGLYKVDLINIKTRKSLTQNFVESGFAEQFS